MTIGRRRLQNQDSTPGPGAYSPEKADILVRPNSPTKSIANLTTRFEKVDRENGPGTSYINMSTLYKGGATMGVRRSQDISVSVGPGEYSPEKADKFTKPKNRVVNFDHPIAPSTSTYHVKKSEGDLLR